MKQILLKTWLILVCLLTGAGTMWAESWSWTPSNTSDLGTATATTAQNVTLNGKSWTSQFNQNRVSFQNTQKALQIGANGSVANGTLKTSDFAGCTIKKVTVNCASYNNAHKVAISVGGVTYKEATSTAKWTTMGDITTGNISATGEIVITVSAGSRAFYLSTITVEYETSSGGSTPIALSAPTNLSSSNVTTSGATLTWDAVTNASSYTVKIGDTEHTGVTTASYSATGLTAGTQYTWTVKAVGDGTNYSSSDYAANANFTTTAAASHKAYFYVNGTLQNEGGTSFAEGASITFPSDPADINNTKFQGWTKTQNYSNSTDAPSDMTKSATMGNADVNYYAVFATVNGNGGTATGTGLSATTSAQVLETGKPITYKSSAANNYSDPVRIYKNGTFTIAGATMTQIVLEGDDSSNPATNLVLKSGEPGSISTGTNSVTWTGPATSVTFVASSAQARVKTITVKYGDVSYSDYCTTVGPSKQTPTLSFANPTYNATMGDAFVAPTLNNPQSVTVTYASSETGVATVNASTGEISLVAPGTTTITASFGGNDDYESNTASYRLVVTAPKEKYVVTIETPQNGTLTIKDGETIVNSGDEVEEGTFLAIVCKEVSNNYRFVKWEYKAGEEDWIEQCESPGTLTMPSADVQLRATFELIPTYTVAWSVNGNIVKSETLQVGTEITAPKVDDIYGKKFTGWVTDSSVDADQTPEYVYPTKVLDNVTYYAVFAYGEDNGQCLLTEDFNTTKASTDQYGCTTAFATVKKEYTYSWELAEGSATVFQNGVKTGKKDGSGTISVSDMLSQIPTGNEFSIRIYAAGWGTDAQNLVITYNNLEKTIDALANGAINSPNEASYDARKFASYDEFKFTKENEINGFSIKSSARVIFDKVEIVYNDITYSDFTTIVSTSEPENEYGEITFVATNGTDYYATFSNDRVVGFEDVIVGDDDESMASVKIYAVNVLDGQLVLTDLYETHNDGTYTYVPKNTGVLLKYHVEDGQMPLTVPFKYADEWDGYLDDISSNNMLRPASAPMTGDCKFYKLAYNNYTNKTGLGFYWGANNGAAFAAKAGGAYLAVPSSVSASNMRGFSFDFEGRPTGIESISNEVVTGEIYNLQGQRINRLQQGVNIVNGRKVIR